MDTYDEYKFKKRIDQLEMEISRLQTDVVELMEMRENDFIQANQTIKNLNQKIQALTTTLITHYDKSWFDQTVSI